MCVLSHPQLSLPSFHINRSLLLREWTIIFWENKCQGIKEKSWLFKLQKSHRRGRERGVHKNSQLQLQERGWEELDLHHGGSSRCLSPKTPLLSPTCRGYPRTPAVRGSPRGWICCTVSCPKRGLPGQVRGRGWLQSPLSTGFSRQEYWSGLPFPSPRGLPNPGVEPRSPALAAGFFTV